MSIEPTKQNISNRRLKKKVFVGLSGGVDSAVSAALLKKEGFDVTGVFIKVWSPEFLPCSWREERRDAMRVAAALDIPFLFLDFSAEYKRRVADYMINEYKLGRTPNPDVMCNKEIKFGAFKKWALDNGADYIATGHYARIDGKKLFEGRDKEKDQSYFLWNLREEDLKNILFPIGDLEKKDVRKLAKLFKLPVADKKDSQGLCFLGDIDLESFLSHFIEAKPGDVLDESGEVIGSHSGALLYTLGERHGFDITKKGNKDKPFFIIRKDMDLNTLTVSNEKTILENSRREESHLDDLNWIGKPEEELSARVRYRQEKFPVKISKEKVVFSTPQIAASGQSLVLYRGEECLGGAIIR